MAKKAVTSQAKGRMAVAQKEQSDRRKAMVSAIQTSGFNSDKFQDPATKKFRNGDGATTVAPPQHGNLRQNARAKAASAAFGSGKPLAKKGK